MKFTYAFLIVILSMIAQVSLIRLLDLFSFVPDLPLVALFLVCYYLTFERILVLSISIGLLIDLGSSVSFGSTILAAFGACTLSFYLRENIFKGGRSADFLLNSLAMFSVFYFLLGGANIFLGSFHGYMEIYNLINLNLAGEMILDLIFSVLGYHLMGYFNSNKIYGFIQNIKISS